MFAHRHYFHKAMFLVLVLMTTSLVINAQPDTYKNYKKKVGNYIQNELYGRIAKVLFDVEVAPEANEFIEFSKTVQDDLDIFLVENGDGLSEKETKLAVAFSQTMLVQLGEAYFEKLQSQDRNFRMEFFNKYLHETNLSNEVDLLTDDLSRSLMMFLHAAVGIPFGMPNIEVESLIQNESEPNREMLRAAMVQNEIVMLSGGYEVSERQVNQFRAEYPKSDFLNGLESSLATLEKLKEGAIVENFVFEDLDGHSISLADFKDKIIYLDLWASWCGPCIQTFRTKTPDFEKQLENNEDIVLMYVSIDEKQESWKNYLSKNPMRGVHVYAGNGFESEIMKYFKVFGIPRYLILGKDNKIIQVNAPRPGDEAYEILMGVKENI